MKKILAFTLVFSLGAVAATGFPTFWQYIESLSGSFLDNASTRSTIINEPITNGELMKANALNAKFGALKKELDDIRTQFDTSTQGVTIGDTLGCNKSSTVAYCYVSATGIAAGESTPRTFLAGMNTTGIYIVVRNVGTQGVQWSQTAYPDLASQRVLYSEVSMLNCGNNCFVKTTGIGAGETNPRNFFASLINTQMYLPVRNTGTQAVQWSPNYSVDLASQRILANEFEIKNCNGTYCYGYLSGIGGGEAVSKTFLSSVNANAVYIVVRNIGTQAMQWSPTTYANVADQRVLSTDFGNIYCNPQRCHGSSNGVGGGESVVRNFSAVLINNELYTLYRMTGTQSMQWSETAYPNANSQRVLYSEIQR